MSTWSFRRRHGVCTACEREFEDGEPHYSTLVVASEEVAREDLCRACWRERPATQAPGPEQAPEASQDTQATEAEPAEAVAGDGEPATGAQDDALFWWRTRHEAGKRKGMALNFEVIEALFIGLEKRSERHLRELRYVLCLLLMRKRRVKIERIVRDAEGESMIVRRPRRKESLKVFVYEFDAERMEAMRGELMRLFDSDEGAQLLAADAAEGAPEDAPASQQRPAGDAEDEGQQSEPDEADEERSEPRAEAVEAS